jgi:hypothetical protein
VCALITAGSNLPFKVPSGWLALDARGDRYMRDDRTQAAGPFSQLQQAWLGDGGRLFLQTDIGFGLVHIMDMRVAAKAVQAGDWQPREMAFADMPERFGFCLRPMPSQPRR